MCALHLRNVAQLLVVGCVCDISRRMFGKVPRRIATPAGREGGGGVQRRWTGRGMIFRAAQ